MSPYTPRPDFWSFAVGAIAPPSASFDWLPFPAWFARVPVPACAPFT